MAKIIHFIQAKRKAATTDLEKDFFKLLSNSVHGSRWKILGNASMSKYLVTATTTESYRQSDLPKFQQN